MTAFTINNNKAAMKILLILLLLMFHQIVKSQAPGGVGGYLIWERPSQGGTDDVEINFNRVANFAARPVDFRLDTADNLKGLSFISVSMCDTLRERALWSLESGAETKALMTNRRFANLMEYRYVNFGTVVKSAPIITSFTSKASPANSLLKKQAVIRVGAKPGSNVPVDGFKGILPEYVIYDRVLSYSERLRVESYLALKYGISINQTIPTHYLNSCGAVIWDSREFFTYRANIAGLGRDDKSGLYQRRSGSMQTPGLLDIACSGLEDGDFLIWGDNNQPLKFLEQRDNPKRLLRSWGIAITGDYMSKPSTLNFSASQIREMNPLQAGEVYWLAIDDTGNEGFLPESTNFYANTSGSNIRLGFENIIWDKNLSGSDVFTLFAAPPMFALIDVEHPRCATNTTGTIKASVVGGAPPFTIRVYREGQIVATQTTNDRMFEFGELQQGVYRLMVSDAENGVFAEDLLLSNADMEEVALFAPVILREGTSKVIDASRGYLSPLDYTFRWHCPEGKTFNGSEITLDKAGVYLLTVAGRDGCSTLREIDVKKMPGDKIRYIEVHPNPAAKGFVYVRVQLARPGPIGVSVSSTLGHMVSYGEIAGFDFYSFRVDLPERGVWIITIDSEGEQKSVKVISK